MAYKSSQNSTFVSRFSKIQRGKAGYMKETTEHIRPARNPDAFRRRQIKNRVKEGRFFKAQRGQEEIAASDDDTAGNEVGDPDNDAEQDEDNWDEGPDEA
jgi:hypothetical protein